MSAPGDADADLPALEAIQPIDAWVRVVGPKEKVVITPASTELDAELSINVLGPTCKVEIGGALLGAAPIFRKRLASGRTLVRLLCPEGAVHRIALKLEPGDSRGFIVKDGQIHREFDWRREHAEVATAR